MEIPVILASKSPRRIEILRDLGFDFRVLSSNIKEISDPKCVTLEDKVISIARKKAETVAARIDKNSREYIVIAADTMVSLEEEVLGKPQNEQDAFHMLQLLSGKKHNVLTATVILDKNRSQLYETATKTKVIFKKLDDHMIYKYLHHNYYMDKAGGYGIQNNGDWLIKEIQGDYFNVMGFSVLTIANYFKKYYNLEISSKVLNDKHANLIRKFKSDGDNNE